MARLPHRPGFRAAAASEELSPAERAALPEGRPEALERFYDVYFPRVYGYVSRLVQDEHAAEDLVQDVFLHLHRALAGYDPARPLRPWVFTIATNKVRDFWSSRKFADRAAGGDDEEDEPASERAADERGPRETLAGAELAQAVAAAIERLPAALRQALVLRYYEDLGFDEIARIVERSEVAVRKRYSRALSELRALLGEVHDLGPAEGGVG